MAKTTQNKSKTKAKAKAKSAGAKTPAPDAPPRQPGVERRKNHPLRAKNGYISILLTNNVPHFGVPGDLIKVRPGFARNYLLPQGLATFATPHNLRIVEKHRERLRALEAARRADLMALAAQIAQRSLTIEANANEEGHLYGSVNAQQIAAALATDGIQVDPDNVRIEGPLRELGFYSIPIHLGMEITGEVKLWVVPTHVEGDEGA
jgi:large subunit ribosomal protein L9